MCYNADGDTSTSNFTDGGGGQELHFEDLVARLNELDLGDNAHHEGISSTSSSAFHSMPYQAYSIDFITDFNADANAEATVTQFLHDHRLNHSERRFLADLSNFHNYPPTLDDIIEPSFFRPHSRSADSVLANPSTGEHSMMSSMTSSMQLSMRGVSPGYFTTGTGGCFQTHQNNFTARPLELTEPLQCQYRCGHGVVCARSPLAREMFVEDRCSECDDGYDEE